MKKLNAALFFSAVLAPNLALAHSDHDATSMLSGLAAGALHPLLGLDHLLTLLLVGGLASQLQGVERWSVVLSFVGLMALGFFSAHAGVHAISTGAVEALISASLVVGAFLMMMGQLAKRYLTKTTLFSSLSAWGMTGFAIFHGFAHGLEIPVGSALSGFSVGFLVMSASLITVGIGLGIKVFVERKLPRLNSL